MTTSGTGTKRRSPSAMIGANTAAAAIRSRVGIASPITSSLLAF